MVSKTSSLLEKDLKVSFVSKLESIKSIKFFATITLLLKVSSSVKYLLISLI